uniref:6-carboxy-5,6,7,8-tetrahydropterin synthase n=1 Tax=candidate division WOR-3 bacterium TaxID=2052148 RepID=A0A7C6EEF6_UNCW3
MSYTIKIRQRFSAAHFLRSYKGKCESIHGHNYIVEVCLRGDKLKKIGLLYDFNEVKEAIKKILPDHQLLNKTLSFNPTCENLARYFYDKLKKNYPVTKVTVWETLDTGAEYEE